MLLKRPGGHCLISKYEVHVPKGRGEGQNVIECEVKVESPDSTPCVTLVRGQCGCGLGYLVTPRARGVMDPVKHDKR